MLQELQELKFQGLTEEERQAANGGCFALLNGAMSSIAISAHYSQVT
jgi:hypothetical protein